jgi:hypothetical protein
MRELLPQKQSLYENSPEKQAVLGFPWAQEGS